MTKRDASELYQDGEVDQNDVLHIDLSRDDRQKLLSMAVALGLSEDELVKKLITEAFGRKVKS